MLVRDLKSFLPTAEELLGLDLPELGEILLVHLYSWKGEGKVWQPGGGLNRLYFVQVMEATEHGLGPARRNQPEYGAKQPEVTRRMQEAWNWLEREGMLMHNPDQPHGDWFLITSTGEELLTRFECRERWDKLGVDRVKSDLMHNEGRRIRKVGGGPKELDMAWEWVRMKEAEAARSSSDAPPTDTLLLDEVNRLLGDVPKGPLDSDVGRWWGGAKNVIERWDSSKSVEGKSAGELFFSNLESVGKGASERRRGQQQMVTLLHQANHDLELRAASMKTTNASVPSIVSRKIFVVHGHDEGARDTIARFVEHLGFEPIILHEQASRGRTVIEKVEDHSDVGFAIVILTPDDEGCKKGGKTQPRARQNVVLELGYFLGRLGRTHVCALKRGDDLEIPSDFEGVVYVTFDNSDGWKQALGRELQAAGFTIDWSKAMGMRT
jgi:predicted nucleotide-binding protein